MLFIAEGKLYREESGKLTLLESGILKKYIAVARDSAKRKEWKYSGDGAKFTGTYQPNVDADAVVEAISARVINADCLEDGAILYSLSINGVSGIYSRPADGGDEGIFLSDTEYRYRDVAVGRDRVLVTAEAVGECHVGWLKKEERVCHFITEGSSRESYPSWSRRFEDCFYYCSAGLEERLITEDNAPRTSTPFQDEMSAAELMKAIRSSNAAASRRQGPCGIYRMSLLSYEIDEILVDEKYNYISPKEDADGVLWFIRYPYRLESEGSGKGFLTVLKDIVLFPFRLIRGIFGFFDFFTMKYSGKTLNSSGASVKKNGEGQRFVLGNLIDAEREQKKNSERGEKYPGYVPHTYELCRMENGKIETVARGVCAFALGDDTLYYSNGSYVLKLGREGKAEKYCKIDGVTGIFDVK